VCRSQHGKIATWVIATSTSVGPADIESDTAVGIAHSLAARVLRHGKETPLADDAIGSVSTRSPFRRKSGLAHTVGDKRPNVLYRISFFKEN